MDLSLGRVACRWIQSHLAVPDGPLYGQPLRLSARQVGLIVDAFTFEDDGRGGFSRVLDRVLYVGPKGEGKSPLAAMLAAFVLAGPSVPYDIDEGGWLVGRHDPQALVQIFANSERQGKRTTWKPLTSMLKNGNVPGVFVGKTFIEFGDARIDYEASSPDSAEGPRVNLAIAEEIQYWRDRDMWALWDAIVRNLSKKDGFVFGPTNAPARGGGSVADDQIRTAEQGDTPEAKSLKVVYPQAPRIETIRGEENRAEVMAALEHVYGEAGDPVSGWVDLERVYKKLVGGKDHLGRRYYLNESAITEGKFVKPDRLAQLERKGQGIAEGSHVALGFDGSEADDATALVAVSLTVPPHIETVGVWRRPDGVSRADFKIPKAEVRAAFEKCRERWLVDVLVGDPSIAWKSFFTDFKEEWGEVQPSMVGDFSPRARRAGFGLVCEVWMNNSAGITDAVVSHFVGLLDGERELDENGDPVDGGVFDDVTFTHDGDEDLVKHLLNMVKTTARNGRFAAVTKESESVDDQVDCGVAAMLGLWGAAQFPTADPVAELETKQATAEPRKSRASRWANK